MSESQRHPQLEPSDHCWSILQDHGPGNGGWGPAAIAIPPLIPQPAPIVYTGSDEHALMVLRQRAQQLARLTGKPTRLVRYAAREDVASFDAEGRDL